MALIRRQDGNIDRARVVGDTEPVASGPVLQVVEGGDTGETSDEDPKGHLVGADPEVAAKAAGRE